MPCAVIDFNTNIVVNTAIADAEVDLPPNGTFLINIPVDSPVSISWVYDPSTQQFTNPVTA